MRFQVITLFPELIRCSLSEGVVGQAFQAGRLELELVNPRDFATDKYKSVDDRPFGGGDSMVMMLEPLLSALESLGPRRGKVVYLSAQGRPWKDQLAREWAASSQGPLTLIAGRYGGVDQRFLNTQVDEEISIGDYVLSGGELAALVVIDSIARHIPGVLGNPDSSELESFVSGRLEGPLFTRPRQHRLGEVPEFLLSGHHARIEELRGALSWVMTAIRRPDLVPVTAFEVVKGARELLKLSPQDQKILGLEVESLRRLAEGV